MIKAGFLYQGGALLLLFQFYGNDGKPLITLLARWQRGIASYPESPTVYLSRVFMKAKVSERRKDRMTKRERLALILKGAHLWSSNVSVSHVKWVAGKEKLPSPSPLEVEAKAA